MQDTKDKTAMAEERTEWAEDRTVLANERTFAGWMRTGMAAVAIAVGLHAVFGKAETPLAPGRLAATLFIFVAIFIFWAAQKRARETLQRLDQHTARPLRNHKMGAIALALALGAAATGVLLWLV
jgi:putative membrane protein